MSNWNSETWSPATDASAWNPGSSYNLNIPSDFKARSLKEEKITSNGKLNNNQLNLKALKQSPGIATTAVPGSKFIELSSSAASNGDWEQYKTESTPKNPPLIPPEQFKAVWEQDSSLLEEQPQTPKSPKSKSPNYTTSLSSTSSPSSAKTKRNIDIEAELNGQNLYKTELCQGWLQTGACRYGEKCQFAHGQDELRPVLRHPKYKTEICKTFSTTGSCPYGKRCRFVHQLSELRSSEQEQGLQVSPEDSTAEIQRKLNELNLSLLSPDPVFPTPSVEEEAPKKGSRLPFFQKLRKQKW